MNRADVQMLNSSLDELGNAFARNRALAEEKQRGDEALGLRKQQLATDQARVEEDRNFRASQMKHYENMEGKESDRNALLEKQIGLKENVQAMAESKQKLQDSTEALGNAVKSGDIDQATATEYFRKAMDEGIGKIDPQMHDQLLAQPQYKLLYEGKRDWSKVADEISQAKSAARTRTTVGANEKLIEDAMDAQTQADQESDPEQKQLLQARADALKAQANKTAGKTPPPTKTVQQVKPTFDPMTGKPSGSTTNLTTTSFSAPASVPVTGTPAAVPQIPVAPMDPSQRIKGQRYKSPKNPATSAVWTGAAWQTDAPQQQVPGFGAAQP